MASTKGPIEVLLTQRNMEVTCLVAHEDESTESLDVDSLSMRGAQREMTGWFIRQGYEPVGRWQTEVADARDGVDLEASRKFRPAKNVDVKSELDRGLTRRNIDEHDFLQAIDKAIRGYFQFSLNATGGDESEMATAINDITSYCYKRFGVLTPDEMRNESGESEDADG